MFLEALYKSGSFFQPSYSLLVYVVTILNSMIRPLCYQKAKFHNALLSFVLSCTFGSVQPTLFGEALFLQCPARWGSLCLTGNLFAAISQNFHAYSTEKPWSPDIIQLIKSVCFSTFPKTYFAFQERREEFPWNLPSALSKLARSRHRAATPASPLSSSWQ